MSYHLHQLGKGTPFSILTLFPSLFGQGYGLTTLFFII